MVKATMDIRLRQQSAMALTIHYLEHLEWEKIIILLTDSDGEIRRYSVWALWDCAWRKNQDLSPLMSTLEKLISDQHRPVAPVAVRALAHHYINKRDLPKLKALLIDSTLFIRGASTMLTKGS